MTERDRPNVLAVAILGSVALLVWAGIVVTAMIWMPDAVAPLIVVPLLLLIVVAQL